MFAEWKYLFFLNQVFVVTNPTSSDDLWPWLHHINHISILTDKLPLYFLASHKDIAIILSSHWMTGPNNICRSLLFILNILHYWTVYMLSQIPPQEKGMTYTSTVSLYLHIPLIFTYDYSQNNRVLERGTCSSEKRVFV